MSGEASSSGARRLWCDECDTGFYENEVDGAEKPTCPNCGSTEGLVEQIGGSEPLTPGPHEGLSSEDQSSVCSCGFGKVIDGMISAEERAGSWHVWKYLAQGFLAHLLAIVGADVVKRAHGCGKGSERNEWIDEIARRFRDHNHYENTPWCMPPREEQSALREALVEVTLHYANSGCENDGDCNCTVHAMWKRVDEALTATQQSGYPLREADRRELQEGLRASAEELRDLNADWDATSADGLDEE